MIISENSIYRIETVFLYVNGVDYETPEDILNFHAQYKADNGGEWTNLAGEYLNSSWEASFISKKESILGDYDFRARFEDDLSTSSDWAYLNDSLEVLNNLPSISYDLDNIHVGIQPLLIGLTQYENDIEDGDRNLTWSIDETVVYTYIESATITDLINDTLKIVPAKNISGSEDIELTLMDKDSGTAIKHDITIIVDSRITDLTPKVTLKSPMHNWIINTLTPTLEWKLDYSGIEKITFTIFIDRNPEPITAIKSSYTATSYTLENELEEGKTYYWKVIPLNGICLSEPFNFTVNLHFQPYYELNITADKNYIEIEQGSTGNIILTVENRGNLHEDCSLEFRSDSFLQKDIQIMETNFLVNPGLNKSIEVTINVLEDMKINIYSIKFIAKSYKCIDEIVTNIEVIKKSGEKPSWDVKINISASSVGIEQGQSEDIILTIINEGNIQDNYTIYFESDDFDISDLTFTTDTLSLEPSSNGKITVTIIVPENLQPGEYTIKFIVKSDSVSDETYLTVNVDKKVEPAKSDDDEEDNIILYASIGIIVIIIVIVSILLFFVVIKKKSQKEKTVEEEAPISKPPPSEQPTELYKMPIQSELQTQQPQQDLCTTCGQQKTYIQQNNRYYCYQCKKYE